MDLTGPVVSRIITVIEVKGSDGKGTKEMGLSIKLKSKQNWAFKFLVYNNTCTVN